MNKEKLSDFLNKIIAVQGDIQRSIIWLSRLDKDCEELKKEVLKDDKD